MLKKKVEHFFADIGKASKNIDKALASCSLSTKLAENNKGE